MLTEFFTEMLERSARTAIANRSAHFIFSLHLCLAILIIFVSSAASQSPVNGGFSGQVTDSVSKMPIAGAVVRFINQENGFRTAKRSDQNGQYYQDTLPPGIYLIEVTYPGYTTYKNTQELYATRENRIKPLPVELVKEISAVTTPTAPTAPTAPTTTVTPATSAQNEPPTSDIDEYLNLNPRRDGAFNEFLVRALPLGGTTLTRSFDELALLVPGVAPPPLAIGNSVGPGVGGGVGTSGQFSVNGLRSRANNFTVDGSDNNDEDIGVRRQGFFALVPQPIESIQEFQIITLLAPAQFGRNLGAQVNVISKSGGNRFSGALFGFFNSDRFNARNFFDNAGGNVSQPLTALRSDNTFVPVFIDGRQQRAFNESGEKDSMTLLHGGFALGGRLVRDKMFFFLSGEGQLLNATKESHFAVPTVEQRGFFGSGAEGICLFDLAVCPDAGRIFPTSFGGDAAFSLFPFPNDPTGIYGRNTLTQTLSADARGRIFSGRYDLNAFSINGNQQVLTARYNYTDDRRDLPAVGGAIFSALRPLVRTDNFSSFFSGGLSSNVSNELRFSWGRTRLKFEEIRDASGFLRPVRRDFTNPDDARFLLNAPLLANATLPGSNGVNYVTRGETETFVQTIAPPGFPVLTSSLGAVGQINIAGFSPVGVDVFNFPQQRVNNTFQIADTVRAQFDGNHNAAFGTDIRRSVLESDLPRNSRPLVTFFGGVNLARLFPCEPQQCSAVLALGNVFSPQDLASLGASSGFFQSIVLPNQDARINLSYYQLNFFAQDDWRIRPNLSVSFGLRYELNTQPEEADRKIENALVEPLPDFVSGFEQFIEGRTKIYEPDRNNFAPRFGLVYAPSNSTVFRAGYGMYYDQILGSVVSQSRNVFPTFNTLNTGGGLFYSQTLGRSGPYTFFNPFNATFGDTPIVQPGTLNTLNPAITDRNELFEALYLAFPFYEGSSFGATLPKKVLPSPYSHQYSVGVEQKLFRDTFLSVAYVGTLGRNLLRFTTPNLGNNYLTVIEGFDVLPATREPVALGFTVDPFTRFVFDPQFPVVERPNPNIGPIYQFETTGRSRYDSLQAQLRGRFSRRLQYQLNYTFGKAFDDVSDVFDLAGAPALPQNSLTFEGEYAPANFDVRHRFSYYFAYDLPFFENRGRAFELLLGGWQIAGTGRYNTGQPFTVNTIYDINHDGNLTDRLNNTRYIVETGDRRQPLALTTNDSLRLQEMLAAVFSQTSPTLGDGAVPRNSFRAADLLELDLSFSKRFRVMENQSLMFRADIFNFINRANFGIPVRYLESPSFGQAVDTVTPGRRIQLGLRYMF